MWLYLWRHECILCKILFHWHQLQVAEFQTSSWTWDTTSLTSGLGYSLANISVPGIAFLLCFFPSVLELNQTELCSTIGTDVQVSAPWLVDSSFSYRDLCYPPPSWMPATLLEHFHVISVVFGSGQGWGSCDSTKAVGSSFLKPEQARPMANDYEKENSNHLQV